MGRGEAARFATLLLVLTVTITFESLLFYPYPLPPFFFQPRLQIAEQQEQIEALIASGAEHPGSENAFPPALQHLLQRRTESLQVWGWVGVRIKTSMLLHTCICFVIRVFICVRKMQKTIAQLKDANQKLHAAVLCLRPVIALV